MGRQPDPGEIVSFLPDGTAKVADSTAQLKNY